jgi:hypothetical protein
VNSVKAPIRLLLSNLLSNKQMGSDANFREFALQAINFAD